MAKVLYVEDDIVYIDLLKKLLTKNGHKVSHAPSAEVALSKLRSFAPDILLLDVGLPGMSGMRLCQLMREQPDMAAIPVLMLTSRNQEAFKVEGLNNGADDYVTKPFSERELLARIDSIVRRSTRQGALTRVAEMGALKVDYDAHVVTVKGKPIDLRPKEYDLLIMFVERRGRVLLYNFIADELWGDERDATRDDVRWYVHKLREKLGPAGDMIETITNQGYKFVEP